MAERKSNDHELGKAVAGLIEQDLSHAEIAGRLGVSRYRIGQVAAAHGLSKPETSTATRRDAQPLTQRQSRMLAFIRDFTAGNPYPPTIREIAQGCNISSTSVTIYNLRRLEEECYLKRVPAIARGIVLTERGKTEAAG